MQPRLIHALLILLAVAGGAIPASAVEVVGGAATAVPIEVSKGRMLRLDAPAARVFIADPEIADVEVMSPRLIYVFARAPGITNLYAVSADEAVIETIELNVALDVAQAAAAIEARAGGAIEASPIGNRVLLTGEAATADQAADAALLASSIVPEEGGVINRMTLPAANQVNLRVRVAEVSREAIEELGIDWNAVVSGGDFSFGVFGPGRAAGDLGTLSGSLQGAVSGSTSIFGQDLDINTFVDALESEGYVSVLAEPNLTALSGETASFLAGGEVPVPIPQDEDTVAILFKEFGVSLAFTPTVLSNSRISMRVRPEVSEVSDTDSFEANGFTIPSFTTRRAETTVELGSGQSFAIAGLFQSEVSRDATKVPFLSDLPMLGALFRSTRFQRNETELVIIITPYLVQPMSDPVAMVPTEPLTAAHGPLAQVRFAGRGVPAGRLDPTDFGGLDPDAGFILK